jgi:hypothetical protein
MKRIILILCLLAAIGIAGCGSKKPSCAGLAPERSCDATNSSVIADLKYLFDVKNVNYGSIPYCTHQSGNQYVCEVDGTDNGTVSIDVSDDGHSVYETGL